MKTLRFKRSFGMIAAGLGVSALSVMAQDVAPTAATASAPVAPPAPVTAPAVSQPAPTPVTLSYGADQVLQLARAKVNDGTILAFIQNTSGGFTLTADQIIYLKQQGISDAILNAMLTQPKTGAPSTATATTPAPATETVVTTVPAATTVYVPNTTTYYYYPPLYRNYPYSYDSCWPYYPAVSFSFGYHSYWGGGFHGGGFHSGGGGYHSGGGFHGGHR